MSYLAIILAALAIVIALFAMYKARSAACVCSNHQPPPCGCAQVKAEAVESEKAFVTDEDPPDTVPDADDTADDDRSVIDELITPGVLASVEQRT